MSAGSGCRLDENVGLFGGSAFIAKELWDPVSKLISHSNDLMQNLFRVVGVPKKKCPHFVGILPHL